MTFRFNGFSFNPQSLELKKGNELLHSEPQVLELLALLIQNSGNVVSKDEINKTIWRGRIVSEAALSSRIKSLRQLLGDDGRKQDIIRTVHKRGFRFVADVQQEPQSNNEQPLKTSNQNVDHATLVNHQIKTKHPTVVVLPFMNMARDPEQEYFSDGVTTDLINHLSRHRWLKVIARNTAFGFKGQTVNALELGKNLNVDYIVEGSLQRAGNRIRIMANLVDAHSGHQIWNERFDREIIDIFDLQDEITEKIAARIEPEIGLAERNRTVCARPTNLQAWDCYHLGIHHFFKFTGEDNEKAQELLMQSQQLDTNFGEAYAWWAYAVILGMVYWKTPPTQQLLDAALKSCHVALSIDSQNSTFHALKARVLLARCEYREALVENEIAIKLNPTFAAAHCGLGDSLAYEGRYAESIECFERSIALSPNDPQVWAFLTYGALALIFDGKFETALEWTNRALTIPNCQYWTTAHRVVALAHLHQIDEAKQTVAKLLQLNPEFSIQFAKEKLFYLKKQEQIEIYLLGLKLADTPD